MNKSQLSPINPSLHYILLLVMALFLVIVVAIMMQKTAVDTRAKLICPNMGNTNQTLQVLKAQCPDGVEYTKDQNGCGTWICRTDEVN